MEKIENLTKEQEAQLAVYREKWIKIGLCTDPVDKADCVKFANWLFKILKRGKPEVIICDGIVSAWNKVVEIASGGKVEKCNFITPYCCGQFDVGYFSFYDFMVNVLGVEIDPRFEFYKLSTRMGPVFPLEKHCIICARPKTIHRNLIGQLHYDGGPALEYRDGSRIWCLNGVIVDQWLAETPSQQIDAKVFPTIENVEVRREFVRKVGVEKLLKDLGSKMIDKDGDYELHLVNLGGTTGEWPYLKMLNPSLKVWHVECVTQSCHTVKEALEFRNGTSATPEVLT